MNSASKVVRSLFAALFLAGVAVQSVLAAPAEVDPVEPQHWQLNMTPGVTSTAANAYHAHMIMFWICVICWSTLLSAYCNEVL